MHDPLSTDEPRKPVDPRLIPRHQRPTVVWLGSTADDLRKAARA